MPGLCTSVQASVSGDERRLKDGLVSCSMTLSAKLQQLALLRVPGRSYDLSGLANGRAVKRLGMH